MPRTVLDTGNDLAVYSANLKAGYRIPMLQDVWANTQISCKYLAVLRIQYPEYENRRINKAGLFGHIYIGILLIPI
jgi:hypothetical protein